jgi:ADP-ribose pyrophosphatase YjhB (NUDIX family)
VILSKVLREKSVSSLNNLHIQWSSVYTACMSKAARAIIIENNQILVMHRDKEGSKYFTLVGGRLNEGENTEQALTREVMEETGMQIVEARLVYFEEHAAPYNEQYIYLCKVAPHEQVAIQSTSEESYMNRIGINTHMPLWADINSFARLPFRTPQLQEAIVKAFKKGFPKEPTKL